MFDSASLQPSRTCIRVQSKGPTAALQRFDGGGKIIPKFNLINKCSLNTNLLLFALHRIHKGVPEHYHNTSNFLLTDPVGDTAYVKGPTIHTAAPQLVWYNGEQRMELGMKSRFQVHSWLGFIHYTTQTFIMNWWLLKQQSPNRGRNTATYKFNDSCRDFAPPAHSVYHTNAISDCGGAAIFLKPRKQQEPAWTSAYSGVNCNPLSIQLHRRDQLLSCSVNSTQLCWPPCHSLALGRRWLQEGRRQSHLHHASPGTRRDALVSKYQLRKSECKYCLHSSGMCNFDLSSLLKKHHPRGNFLWFMQEKIHTSPCRRREKLSL